MLAAAGDTIRHAAAAVPETHVRVSGLDKRYLTPAGASVDALRGIDLELRRGEFVSVVGPSGCGKSTLLKCIAGLTEITAGTIEVAQRPVIEPPDDMAIV